VRAGCVVYSDLPYSVFEILGRGHPTISPRISLDRTAGRRLVRAAESVKSVKFILDVAIKEKAIFYFSRNSPTALRRARASPPFLSLRAAV
jgi:hypothetical protein